MNTSNTKILINEYVRSDSNKETTLHMACTQSTDIDTMISPEMEDVDVLNKKAFGTTVTEYL